MANPISWLKSKFKEARENSPPLGLILRDKDANTELHRFLLQTLDKDTTTKIKIEDETSGKARQFTVGIIDLNPAFTFGSIETSTDRGGA